MAVSWIVNVVSLVRVPFGGCIIRRQIFCPIKDNSTDTFPAPFLPQQLGEMVMVSVGCLITMAIIDSPRISSNDRRQLGLSIQLGLRF
jgi:hypothetical protein